MAEHEAELASSPSRDNELWEAAMANSTAQFQEEQQLKQMQMQQPMAGSMQAGQMQQQSSMPTSGRQQAPMSGMTGYAPHGIGQQNSFMGHYGLPRSTSNIEPAMLMGGQPTQSLPVPSTSRLPDAYAGYYEAPAAVESVPQAGRPIGNIGQVGGSNIGKIGSSSNIGSQSNIGQVPGVGNLGRVSIGHVQPASSRNIGHMGNPSIGQFVPSMSHAGSGIGQIGNTGTEMTLVRPGMGHLPHTLSAKQQSLLSYAGGMNQMGGMGMGGYMMPGYGPDIYAGMGPMSQMGQLPPGAMYGHQVGGMYGLGGPSAMMGQPPIPGLVSRPGSLHGSSSYDTPGSTALPNHVSIHSVPDSNAGTEPGLDKLTSAASLATQVSNVKGPKIKIICSSGGHFQKVGGGGLEYVGGETRLISVSSSCNFTELSAALDRVTGSLTIHSGQSIASGSDSAPSLRYQLPSDPNVYVDLLDTEDVKMMFDEWQEWLAEEKRPASSKLHIYIQNVGTKPPLDAPATPNASQPQPAFSKATSGKGPEPEANRNSDASAASEPAPQPGQSAGAPSMASNDSWKKKGLEDIAERMEVISPEDVSLVKFIGSGGYGEVYLGKWHSSEAAIKCLNTSLFTNTSDSGAKMSHAAINELIREAELLGSLRHPNVVWVYGIVLPPVEEPHDSGDIDTLIDSAEPIEIASAMSHNMPGQGSRKSPGTLRPPAIITEFMSQGSLKGALSRRLEILQPPLMRLMVALDAAKGMEYLHAKRIVHFDLKSANLLLGHRDKRLICKVADFGLSKQKRDTYVTGVTSQRGTLPWIAPEIIKSPHAVNEKVDVFSFGVVLWEIWTGKEPYEGLNYHALLHQLTSAQSLRPPVPGSQEWERDGNEPLAELAPGFCNLMQCCWSESPAQRPTFHQVVGFLRDMANAIRPAPRQRPGAPGVRPGVASPM